MRSPRRGRFRSGLRRFAETRPVHGECGGYMVLGESLEDAAGQHHAMTGLLGHATSFAKRKLHLGYRTARLLSDTVLGRQGAVVRGHEFHYASLTSAGGDEALPNLRWRRPRARQSRRPARPRHRHVLSRHRRGGGIRRSALQQRHRAEAAVGADADDRATTRGIRGEFLDRLTQNARAGGRERMAERNAAAVRIHPLARKPAECILDAGFGADEILILQRLDVAGTCAENASWISHSAMSSYVSPCRANNRGMAVTGAISKPSWKISTAAISKSTRRTRGACAGNRRKPFVGRDPDGGGAIRQRR